MTKKSIKIFINEIYSKPPKKNTNKTDVYHIDDIWSSDILDLKDYGPENKKQKMLHICFSYHRQSLKIWLDNSFKK